MSRYQTWAGKAKEPFTPAATHRETIDALGNTVFDTAGGVLKPLLWTDYQAEMAGAGSVGGAGYSGNGFISIFYGLPVAPAPVDRCTCGSAVAGLGGHSSWCDSSAARAQHSGGAP